MAPKAKRTFTREELEGYKAQLSELPRFKNTHSTEEAVRELAPVVNMLLDRGRTLNDIAFGIQEMGMMSAETFRRYWSTVKNAGASDPKKADKKPGKRPTTSATKSDKTSDAIKQPATADEPVRTGTTGETRPAEEPPKRRGMLVPEDGKFD